MKLIVNFVVASIVTVLAAPQTETVLRPRLLVVGSIVGVVVIVLLWVRLTIVVAVVVIVDVEIVVGGQRDQQCMLMTGGRLEIVKGGGRRPRATSLARIWQRWNVSLTAHPRQRTDGTVVVGVGPLDMLETDKHDDEVDG